MIRRSVLLLCLVGSAAHAGPDPDPLRRGVRHYTYGEYGQAIQELTRAGRSTQDPKTLARIYLYLGLSHAVIGAEAKAERCFVTAMTHDPLVGPDPARIKPELVTLFTRTRERQHATLRVEADQPGAVAVVDGQPPARLPLQLTVPIGSHTVEVRSADGQLRETRELLAPPKAVIQISARLGSATRRSERRGANPAAARLRGAAPGPGRAAKEQPGRRRVWTWITAGGALASFAVAGGLWASVQADMKEYDDPATADARALALEDPIRRKVLATNVMIGLGGVLGASAAVLFFLEGRRPSTIRPAAGVGDRGTWIGARVSF